MCLRKIVFKENNAQHLNYDVWKNSKSDEIVVQNIKTADHVITTTSLFAERISQENPNVSVIENAVNLDPNQYEIICLSVGQQKDKLSQDIEFDRERNKIIGKVVGSDPKGRNNYMEVLVGGA